jgi:predicted dehydrogenase/nucleoside-diphosphate-sugar epimerase
MSAADRPLKAVRRVAVIGAGYIADFHIPILRELPHLELVAICDSDLSRAQSLASRYQVGQAVRSIAELKALGVELAHVLVPPNLHASLVRELLEAGIGAYVEKPFVLSSREARELGELARARALALGVHHNHAHHPAFLRLLERVRAGAIGRVEHVQANWALPLAQLDAQDYSHWMFREPANILFEQAVHPLSQVHALLGAVREGQATLLETRELNGGARFVSRWALDARAERGTAQVYLSFGSPFPHSSIRVLGTDGMLEADCVHDSLTQERKSLWLEFWNSFLATRGRSRALSKDAWRVLRNYLSFTLGLAPRKDAFWLGMRSAIESFHIALRDGQPLPCDAFAAAQVLEWVECAARSAPAAPAETQLPAPGPARPGETLVLGATGFIGKRTIHKLLEAGTPVTIVARRSHALPTLISDNIRNGRIRFFRGSLEDPAALKSAMQGAACVIQLATGGGDTWEKVERSMVRGSEAMALAAAELGVGRFVYVSTIAALYTGPEAGSEIRDSLETDPMPQARPLYSRGKIAAEQALMKLARERSLPLTIVRPGVVVGAGTPMQHSGYGLWTRDNQCIGWGEGDTGVPLVWVDDVADALARLARHPGHDLDGQALNLCARTDLTARELVAELSAHTGRPLEFHARSLALSQAMEIGKWVIKKLGRRKGVEFPSWRDLKARSLCVPFTSDLARTKLAWKPLEEREALLNAAIRVYR